MKRKVIQIAGSTQLISLPRKWALRYNIKKGEELEIKEQGSRLIISTEENVSERKLEVDITGLDRTTILLLLQGTYRLGYDEIKLNFSNPTTKHFRTNEKRKVISVIHEVGLRLMGMDIIQQRENFVVLKELTSSSIKEFDSIIRRIFLLLLDASHDLAEGCKSMNMHLIDTIEEKHDTITKFVSLCLRILNKKGYKEPTKICTYYQLISQIDKITDVLKYRAREFLDIKKPLSNDGKKVVDLVHKSLELFYDLFYKFDLKKAMLVYETRDNVLKTMLKMQSKADKKEIIYLNNLASLLELVVDVLQCRIALEN